MSLVRGNFRRAVGWRHELHPAVSRGRAGGHPRDRQCRRRGLPRERFRRIAGTSRTWPTASSRARSPSGIAFWGYEDDGGLIGVMGIQPVGEVDLIRHAYVLPGNQGRGVGRQLLVHLRGLTERRMLVGTWAAAEWAIRFYRRNGFEQVSPSARRCCSRRTGTSRSARSRPRWYSRTRLSSALRTDPAGRARPAAGCRGRAAPSPSRPGRSARRSPAGRCASRRRRGARRPGSPPVPVVGQRDQLGVGARVVVAVAAQRGDARRRSARSAPSMPLVGEPLARTRRSSRGGRCWASRYLGGRVALPRRPSIHSRSDGR